MEDATTRRRTGCASSASSSTAVPRSLAPDIALHRIHALSDADLGREMHHRVGALHGARHGRGVTHVALDQLNLLQNRIGRTVPMHLVDQAVEHAHGFAALKQCLREMTANEPGASGNQNPFCRHRHPLGLRPCDGPNGRRNELFQPYPRNTHSDTRWMQRSKGLNVPSRRVEEDALDCVCFPSRHMRFEHC